jgi:hypothetical protein
MECIVVGLNVLFGDRIPIEELLESFFETRMIHQMSHGVLVHHKCLFRQGAKLGSFSTFVATMSILVFTECTAEILICIPVDTAGLGKGYFAGITDKRTIVERHDGILSILPLF